MRRDRMAGAGDFLRRLRPSNSVTILLPPDQGAGRRDAIDAGYRRYRAL